MKDTYSKKGLYIGAGIGIVLFALLGIWQGSFLGGVMGLGIAGTLFGEPVEPGVIQRVIVAVSMLMGVMVSGIMFVVGSSTFGWLMGTALDAITGRKAVEAKELNKNNL